MMGEAGERLGPAAERARVRALRAGIDRVRPAPVEDRVSDLMAVKEAHRRKGLAGSVKWGGVGREEQTL